MPKQTINSPQADTITRASPTRKTLAGPSRLPPLSARESRISTTSLFNPKPVKNISESKPKSDSSDALAALKDTPSPSKSKSPSKSDLDNKETGELDEKRMIEELEALAGRILSAEDISELESTKPEFKERKFIEAAQRLYFYPSEPFPGHTDNLDDIRRNIQELQDEGFSVDAFPDVEWTNWLRMERRLLHEENQGSKWFGLDGRMIVIPDITTDLIWPTPSIDKQNFIEVTGGRKVDPLGLTMHKPVIPTKASGDFLTDETFQLVFNFFDVRLTEHPLMIEETRKSIEIAALVQALASRKKSNLVEFLEGKVIALQQAYADFKFKYPDAFAFFDCVHAGEGLKGRVRRKTIQNVPDQDKILSYNKQKKEYLEQIRVSKERLESESRQSRVLEWKILKLWESLKEVRHKQKFISSSLKLVLNTAKANEQEDRNKLLGYIESDINERRELFEIQKLTISQNAELNETMARNDNEPEIVADPVSPKSEPVTPRRRRRRAETGKEDGGLSEAETPVRSRSRSRSRRRVDENDSGLVNGAFDENKVRHDVAQNVETSFRPAGMPVLNLKVAYTEKITPTEECPATEQLRRTNVEGTSLFVKLHINGKEVIKSNQASLTFSDFKCSLGETDIAELNLQIREVIKDIKVEVYERSAFGDYLLGDCSVPIPDPIRQIRTLDQAVSTILFEGKEFKLSSTFDTYAKAAGKDMKRTQSGDTRAYSGIIRVITVWDVDDNGVTLAPHSLAKKRQNLAIVSEDPNDLRFQHDETQDMRRLSATNAAPLGDELSLVPLSEDYLRRLELLQLRNQRKLKTNEPIPLVQEEIDSKFMEEQSENELSLLSPATSDMNTQVSEFLKRIKNHDLYKAIQSQPLQKPIRVEDVVREEKPAEATDENFLAVLFKQRRPLKPERLPRQSKATSHPESCKIVCQVLRGTNVPIRVGGFDGNTRNRGMLARKGDNTVQTYIEVQFQRNREKTSVVQGTNPQWNETLSMPFVPPDGSFSPESIQNVRDNIYINLFDEYKVDLMVDDRDRDTHVHTRKERNWLGTIVIPFASIYKSGVIEGRFHLQTPVIFFGYEKDDRDGDLMGVNTDETMVDLFITLEPILEQPQELKPKFETNEDKDSWRLAQRWNKRALPRRPLSAAVLDMNGRWTIVTRFIRPLAPPNGYDFDKIVRFVSNIPYFDDRNAVSASLELWSNSQEMLDIGAGDDGEHAILLCNYLLHLNKNAYVLVGRGLLEGKAAFVYVEEASAATVSVKGKKLDIGRQIINPMTGLTYNPKDSHCPVQEVYYVFNHVNAWANIQKVTSPSQIGFNFANKAEWLSLLPSDKNRDLPSIQPEKLTYQEIFKSNLKELEKNVQHTLTSKIEKWRGRFVTKWNRSCSKVFEAALPILEERKSGKPNASLDIFNTEMKKLQNVYLIRGFPLNMPFTDLDSVIEAVFNTDVFNNRDSTVEFALAVYCHPFVNNVVSIWIYIASLTKRD